MNDEFHMHDVVVLLEGMLVEHFKTGMPLMLRRGQIGTIVMTYDGSAFEVEFSDPDGRTYALLPVEREKLILVKDRPETAVA